MFKILYQYPLSEVFDLVRDNVRRREGVSHKRVGDVCRKPISEEDLNEQAVANRALFEHIGQKWISGTLSGYLKEPTCLFIAGVRWGEYKTRPMRLRMRLVWS